MSACKTEPSLDQAYKPSVARTIPCTSLIESEPKPVFKIVPVSAGKFTAVISVGDGKSATPSYAISSPQTL